jgi:hypothetical protein
MKITILSIFFCLFLVGTSSAEEIRLLNLDILGRPLTNTGQILSPLEQRGTDPVLVTFMTHKGRIHVVIFQYPTHITFEELRRAIDKVYGKYKQPDQGSLNNPHAWWYIPKGKIEIQMDRNEHNLVEVTYSTNESFEW